MVIEPPVYPAPATGPTVSTTAATTQQIQIPARGFAQLPFWHQFHVRMAALYGVVVFLILTLMGATFYHIGVQHQVKALQSRLRTAATTLSHEIRPEAVLALNVADDRQMPEYRELTDLFRRVAADEPQFVSIYVLRPTERPNILFFAADFVIPGRTTAATVGEEYDARQAARLKEGFLRPTVESEFTTDRWGTVLSGYAPIRTADGKVVALVGIDVAEDDVARMKSDVRKVTFGIFGFAALCLGIVAWFVGGNIRRPLGQITNATTEIAAGKLETRVHIRRVDEFGILGRHLDEMAAGLGEREIIRATFGRFVSEDVARFVLSTHDGTDLGGEERIVTVLFTDLANYSTISEKLSPADVVRLLNTYFGLMVEIIERHHGCVIDFAGDGILCVFGAPNAAPNHAEQAVQCAVEMQAELAAANRVWERAETKLWHGQGAARLQMRIGIHTGAVIAGNIGAPSRLKYAVIGDSVNVASRVEQLNKELETETLLTEETLIRLSELMRSRTAPRGEHNIKGRVKTVVVHSI